MTTKFILFYTLCGAYTLLLYIMFSSDTYLYTPKNTNLKYKIAGIKCCLSFRKNMFTKCFYLLLLACFALGNQSAQLKV